MIGRWLIAKAMVLLSAVAALTLAAIGGGRLAPPRPQLYYLSWQDSLAPEIVAFDFNQNLSPHFAPEPPLPQSAQIVTQWTISPDGQYFVFKNGYNLMRMDVNGRNQHWLTEGLTNNHSPAWSPDGTHIAFVSERDVNEEIYLMGADGSNPQRLTANNIADRSPAWSPDGRYIAFVSFQDGDGEIEIVATDGNDLHPLIDNDLVPTERSVSAPSWSPDGQHILFMSYRDGYQKIYVIDADGNREHPLTKNNDYETSPSWSPDGQYILFTSNSVGATYEIYLINADGSDQHLIRSLDGTVSWLSWSQDGQFIMFQMAETYTFISHIYIMNVDGSNLRALPKWNLPMMTPLWFRP